MGVAARRALRSLLAAMVALVTTVACLGGFGAEVAGGQAAPRQDPSSPVRSHQEEVEELLAAIAPFEGQQITFTEATGMLPFTLENRLSRPVDVLVDLYSDKLEFPEGSQLQVTLPPGPTGLEVAVESRASGSFPLDITVHTPDGSTEIVSARFTVRSTAISGLGLALAVGAGLFLLIWWARHFRNVRRDRRLVSTNHPARWTSPPDGEPDG